MRLAELVTEIREELDEWNLKEFVAIIRVASAEEVELEWFHSQQQNLREKYNPDISLCIHQWWRNNRVAFLSG